MIINLSDILQEGHNTILQHGFQEEKKNSFYSIIFSRKKIRLYDERSRNAYTSSCHQLEKQRFNRDIFQDTFLSDNFKSKRREEFQYWNIFLIFLLIPFFFFFFFFFIEVLVLILSPWSNFKTIIQFPKESIIEMVRYGNKGNYRRYN